MTYLTRIDIKDINQDKLQKFRNESKELKVTRAYLFEKMIDQYFAEKEGDEI